MGEKRMSRIFAFYTVFLANQVHGNTNTLYSCMIDLYVSPRILKEVFVNTHPQASVLLLVLATLLWSGNFVAGRFLAGAISPFFLNGVRWLISAILLLSIARARSIHIPLIREWKRLFLLGFTGMFGFSALTYLSLEQVTAAQAGMITGFAPVSILLFSMLLIAEKVTKRSWLGISLSVVGVLVLVAGQNSGGALSFSLGDFEVLASTLVWGFYTALNRRYRHYMSPFVMTAGAAIYGAIPSVITGLISLPYYPMHLNLAALWSIAYVSTIASVVAYFVWNQGVHLVGAQVAAPFINLLPVFAVILGMLLLHESIGFVSLIGGFITIFGALIAGFPSRSPHPNAIQETSDVS